MDNITHTLFGATLGRTPLGRAGRGTTAALLIASNAPDIDIVAAARGSASYLHWHRGPTHGTLGVVGLGLLTAALVWLGRRAIDLRRPPPPGEENASFAMLASVSTIAVLLHVLMDLPTSYGTRLLSPFDWHWYAMDWLPIIDIFLLVILVTGLVIGRLAPESRRRVTLLALVLMAGDYGLRATAHHQALEIAPRLFGPLLPARCDATRAATGSPIDVWPRAQAPAAASTRPCLVEIAAMPTFLSPFRWRLVAHLSDAYELHDVDLLDRRLGEPESTRDVFWRLSVRYPDRWTPPVFRAAATPVARVFLGFSRFPAARAFADPTGAATVRWNDMRFAGGIFSLASPRRPDPFTVTVRFAPDGSIVQQQMGR